ncbi:hypothetical protein QTP88_018017 [Uroleucon formosanum]
MIMYVEYIQIKRIFLATCECFYIHALLFTNPLCRNRDCKCRLIINRVHLIGEIVSYFCYVQIAVAKLGYTPDETTMRDAQNLLNYLRDPYRNRQFPTL